MAEEYWEKLENALNILKPISETINAIEGDGLSLCYVSGHLAQIKQKVSQAAKSFSKIEEQLILTNLEERTEFVYHDVQLATRFLKPDLHETDLNAEDVKKAMNYIEKLAEQMPGDDIDKVELLVELAEYRAKKDWATDSVWAAATKLNGITWWKGFFPHKILSRIACDILSFPATTGSCERNFKTFANIKTRKRNRLLVERTNKLVFVKHNLKYVKEDLKMADERDCFQEETENNAYDEVDDDENSFEEETDEEIDYDTDELVDDSDSISSESNNEIKEIITEESTELDLNSYETEDCDTNVDDNGNSDHVVIQRVGISSCSTKKRQLEEDYDEPRSIKYVKTDHIDKNKNADNKDNLDNYNNCDENMDLNKSEDIINESSDDADKSANLGKFIYLKNGQKVLVLQNIVLSND